MLTRTAAARLSPDARRRVRRAADAALGPLSSVCGADTPRRWVALTYDDGPEPGSTEAVLGALAATGATATFFQLVERAERYPGLVGEVVAAGHEIGLHGIDHRRLTELPSSTVHRLVVDGKRRLEDVAGVPITLFRPAYGSQTVRTLLAVRSAGLQVVVWGPSAEDWRDGSPEEIAGRALSSICPGDVVLLHDGFETPPGDPLSRPTFDRGQVCRSLLAGLTERGYAGTSVTGLLTAGRPRTTAWFRP